MQLSGHTVVYGGSFNPPHLGHQMTCLYLLEALDATAVWLVPVQNHPFGKKLVDFSARAEMCALLAAPFAGRVQVSQIEAEPQITGKTYDTLVTLKERHPARRFALVVGADVLGETAMWYRWTDIEAMVPVVVVGRGGYPSTRATPLEMPAVASADLRRRLLGGESVAGLVPARILEYIDRHRLYRE